MASVTTVVLAAAAGLFIGACALVALREKYRLVISASASAIVVLSGIVPPGLLVPTSIIGEGSVIEWNTIALLLGLFLFAGLLQAVGFFHYVSERIAKRAHGRPLQLFLGLSLLSFGLSAFLNSITVTLVLASVTLKVTRNLGLNPAPYLLAEISASNAGGAATFVGDPPNVILGTYFQLSFGDFLFHTGLPALAALGVIVLLMARGLPRTRSEISPVPPPLSGERLQPRAAIGAAVGFGAILGVLAFQAPLGVPVWVVGLGGALLAALIALLTGHGRKVLAGADYGTLVFFLFLFVLVGGLQTSGAIGSVGGLLASGGAGNLLLTGTLLLWSLGLLSTIVNNAPLASAAASLINVLNRTTGLPVRPLVWASALGTDLGGNGTPIGASANMVGLATARKMGIPVSWPTYLKIAFPTTVGSLLAANLVWILLH